MEPVIIKNQRVLEETEPCIRMRTGPIYRSPWFALSFWPTMVIRHMSTNTHASFSDFNMSIPIVSLILSLHWLFPLKLLCNWIQRCIYWYSYVKTLLEEIAGEWQHAIKTTNHIYFWKAKRQLNAHGKSNCERLGKMLISTDLNAQKTTLQITVWWCHLVCIMTSYDKWQRSGSHSIITSWLKPLRLRLVLGKWAPDSTAKTTLFNVTTRIFGIIRYVESSMFATDYPSQSKL